MRPVVSFILVFVTLQSVLPQAVMGTRPAEPAVREEIDALKVGKQVTFTLTSGKKVRGSVLEKPGDSVKVRVGRGFFRYRTETYPAAEIASVKKHMPAWVAPVVVLGVVGGVVIGVAACVASGACVN